MSKVFFKDMTPAPLGPHRDYEQNLSVARTFCSRVQKSLLDGMSAKITDSGSLKEALLNISFQPPREDKMGNYCAPIFLHQDRSSVSKQTEAVFMSYLALARKFWDSQPKMVQGELLDVLECPKFNQKQALNELSNKIHVRVAQNDYSPEKAP